MKRDDSICVIISKAVFVMEITSVLMIFGLLSGVWAQQYFRVKPHDTSVVEGRTAELHCHVGNRVGKVQWSKDGFLLGYDPDIPGHERYEMRVDHPNSAYTLLVHGARLEDEGEFQCQVGPGKTEKPIRSVARLTVLVPPESVSINSLANNSTIEVREAEKVVLQCQALSSKPATILKWFRKNVELMPEASKTSVRREGEKRYTTVSSITLYPKGEASGVPYSCEAFHPALQNPLRTTVTIQVLYPPSPPEIKGYRDGEVVQAGDVLKLACVSKGGKPPARLVWYRNGDVLEGTYSTMDREATNILEITVVPEDNNVIYGCAAVNPLTTRPLFTTIKLNVFFPPKSVILTGPSTAHRGDIVSMDCRSDVSNPAAEITWTIDGEVVDPEEVEVLPDERGWYTTSKVTDKISRQDTDVKTFVCTAVGVPQHESVFQSFNITIMYPPESPEISRYFEGEVLKAGQVHEFLCTAVAGNPPAEIVWIRGGKELHARREISNGVISSVLKLEMEASDNEAYLKCQVNNSASPSPLFAEAKLNVLFPPANVSITVDPPHPKEGEKARLECVASTSNPSSKIIWWQNGRLLTGHLSRTKASSFGGLSTMSTLNVKPLTSLDDGSKFTCEAKNEAFDDSVQEHVIIRVKYAPEFSPHDDILELVEGQSGEFNISARAYPEVHQYVWNKMQTPVPVYSKSSSTGLQPRVSSDGPLLVFYKVARKDSGQYSCTARNSEGTSSTTLTLNVLYPAIITNLTSTVEVPEGETASLECEAEGNPMPDGAITWRAKKSQQALIPTPIGAGKSVLTLTNISRQHGDIIECVADNGVGAAAVRPARLIVMYRPYVLREEIKRRVAVGNRTSAHFDCGAEGHPKITFTWSYNGTTLASGAMENTDHAAIEERRSVNHWWSRLTIKKVDWSNFGVYTCVAGNELGHDFITFTLTKTGPPDQPLGLEASNLTHQSLNLRWKAGFDGGMPQTFVIRFKDFKDTNYTYVEVPRNGTSYHVTSLEEGTSYEFSVAAKNSLGISDFSSEVKIRTRNVPVMDSTVSQLDSDRASDTLPSWLLALAIIGGIVVVVNVLLCIGYFRKKNMCGDQPGDPSPELHTDDDELSREKKIVKKKKIPGEEDTPPFYLSGTTVDLPDDGLDLSSFQKVPSLRQISRDTSDDCHSCDSRRCDCGGKQWGGTLSCGASGHDPSHNHEHQECPDILKRDSCHCLSSKTSRVAAEGDVSLPTKVATYARAQEKEINIGYTRSQSPLHVTLSTFQPKSELPIRHSLLDIIGPKLETVINGDGEDS